MHRARTEMFKKKAFIISSTVGAGAKAARFYKEVAQGKKHTPYLLIRAMFLFRKMIMKKYEDDSSLDKKYWIAKGWYQGEKNPWI